MSRNKDYQEDPNFEDKHQTLIKNYQHVFDSASGKKVIEDLIQFNKSTLIDRNNPNPNAALYSIAQRTIINRILTKLEGK